MDPHSIFLEIPMKKLVLVLFLALLAGCSSMGKSVDIEKAYGLEGKTIAEVRETLGDPMHESFDAYGNGTMVYMHYKMRAKTTNYIPVVNLFKSGYDSKRQQATLTFENGRVSGVSAGGGSMETRTGLIQ